MSCFGQLTGSDSAKSSHRSHRLDKWSFNIRLSGVRGFAARILACVSVRYENRVDQKVKTYNISRGQIP